QNNHHVSQQPHLVLPPQKSTIYSHSLPSHSTYEHKKNSDLAIEVLDIITIHKMSSPHRFFPFPNPGCNVFWTLQQCFRLLLTQQLLVVIPPRCRHNRHACLLACCDVPLLVSDIQQLAMREPARPAKSLQGLVL